MRAKPGGYAHQGAEYGPEEMVQQRQGRLGWVGKTAERGADDEHGVVEGCLYFGTFGRSDPGTAPSTLSQLTEGSASHRAVRRRQPARPQPSATRDLGTSVLIDCRRGIVSPSPT